MFGGHLILLHRFATPSGEFDPAGMLALGFVVLANYTVGELVGVIKLPHITGYLFAGLAWPLLCTLHAHSLHLPPSIECPERRSHWATGLVQHAGTRTHRNHSG